MTDTHRDIHDADCELDPEALFANHRETGEPLNSEELAAILAAGVAPAEEFEERGGGLAWHLPTFANPEAAEVLPIVQAGEPCPACGGRIVVDGSCHHTRVPIYADGTPTDEGEGGDFEWDDTGPYCADCRERVRIEW